MAALGVLAVLAGLLPDAFGPIFGIEFTAVSRETLSSSLLLFTPRKFAAAHTTRIHNHELLLPDRPTAGEAAADIGQGGVGEEGGARLRLAYEAKVPGHRRTARTCRASSRTSS